MMCYGAICNTSLPLSHWFTLSSGKSNRNQWPVATHNHHTVGWYVRKKNYFKVVPVFSQMIDLLASAKMRICISNSV